MRNRHILKYHLSKVGRMVIHTGSDPIVRSVGCQNGNWMVWIECDASSQLDAAQVEFLIVGTGHEFDFGLTDLAFVGTVHTPEGFVWHVFCEAQRLEPYR